MNLFEAECDGFDYLQGYVTIVWPSSALDIESSRTWRLLFNQAAASWKSCSPQSVGFRFVSTPKQPLEVSYSYVVDRKYELQLRSVLANFMKLDGLGGCQVQIPENVGVLKKLHKRFDWERIGLGYSEYLTPKGTKIYSNTRLSDHLKRLIEELCKAEISFAYELHISPITVRAQMQKRVLKNYARLVHEAGAPDGFIATQRDIAQRVKIPSYRYEECLAVRELDKLSVVKNFVANIHAENDDTYFRDVPRIAPIDADHKESFMALLYSEFFLDTEDDDVLIPQNLSSEESVGDILTCGFVFDESTPLYSLRDSTAECFDSAADSIDEILHSDSTISDIAPFVFISYARENLEASLMCVEQMNAAGISAWRDNNIEIGVDWYEELEKRISGCACVIALVSKEFYESKHCKRELRYADALQKPILPMILDGAQPSSGWNFLMQSIQWTEFDDTLKFEKLIISLKRQIPDFQNI